MSKLHDSSKFCNTSPDALFSFFRLASPWLSSRGYFSILPSSSNPIHSLLIATFATIEKYESGYGLLPKLFIISRI